MKILDFRLQVLDPAQERIYPLAEGVTIAGREASANLVLANPLVSRRHAQFTLSNNQCLVTDLGSANGTFLNGTRLAPNVPTLLNNGDSLRIGPFELRFEVAEITLEDAPLPSPPVPEITPAAPTPELPPAPPQPPAEPSVERSPAHEPDLPPGLTLESQRLINFLPGIYQTDFMSRFLGLFESVLTPIEWNIDNFDLFLDPETSPTFFMSWLANWYQISFDSTWREDQRRTLLKEAHNIYARRGTRWALGRVLEIYTDCAPEIIDNAPDMAPYSFTVRLPLTTRQVNQELVMRLIDANKPAYTTYTLEFLK